MEYDETCIHESFDDLNVVILLFLLLLILGYLRFIHLGLWAYGSSPAGRSP